MNCTSSPATKRATSWPATSTRTATRISLWRPGPAMWWCSRTPGTFFLQRSATDPPYRRHFFPRFDNSMARARDIQVVEVNGDNDPDLLVGTGSGTQVLLGKPGMSFERKLYATTPGGPAILPVVPTINFPVDAMVTADLDGDGERDDVAAICATDGCLNILTSPNDGTGRFLPALGGRGPADHVPRGRRCGWRWQNRSRRHRQHVVGGAEQPRHGAGAADGADDCPRPGWPQVVINEILPNNTKVSVTDPAQPGAVHRR